MWVFEVEMAPKVETTSAGGDRGEVNREDKAAAEPFAMPARLR